MSLACRILSMKHVGVLGCAALVAASLASAQNVETQSSNSASNSGWSSSQAGQMQVAEGAVPASPAALPSPPAPAAQDNNGDTYSGWHGSNLTHRLTFELGAGFNGPIGNDTNQAGVVATPIPVITWGGNFNLWGGRALFNSTSALLEYQFMDDKLPGVLIGAINNATGDADNITAGNTHINSITGSPVIDLFPKRSWRLPGRRLRLVP